jgi:hypothetical protein
MNASRKTALATLAAALLAVASLATPAWAKPPKDMDGERMGAAQLTLGASAKDSLSASDASDWRYVKLTKGGVLSVELTTSNKDAVLTFQLIDSTGAVIESEDKATGGLKLKRKLDAGIYYLRVSCAQALQYELKATVAP